MGSVKTELHPRNPHRGLYDFKQLISSCPDLAKFVMTNQYGIESINFSNPRAVKTLNKAPIIFQICSVFITITSSLKGSVSVCIRVLDIGVVANCIYPLIGYKQFGWNF